MIVIDRTKAVTFVEGIILINKNMNKTEKNNSLFWMVLNLVFCVFCAVLRVRFERNILSWCRYT